MVNHPHKTKIMLDGRAKLKTLQLIEIIPILLNFCYSDLRHQCQVQE